MKSGKFLLILFFSFCSLFFFANFVQASLGISPAISEYDFVPGEKIEIIYSVSTDDPNNEIEIFVDDSDFGASLLLSRQKLVGPGTFKLTVVFPEGPIRPGEHRIYAGVKEVPDESQFIGTAIVIGSVIKVQVPYPGRYAEASLNIPDGNVDEQIPVELNVVNRGKETLNVDPHINFISEVGELVHTMDFSPVALETGQDRYFRKYLDTNSYRPGDYIAEAVVDFGEQTTVNQTVRIGYLHVGIVNFTEQLSKGGIQKFLVNVESEWNGDLDDVYADVNLSNDLESISFRTPAVDLDAWGANTLTGFLDTDELKGDYKTDVVLSYAGEQTFATGLLMIVEFNYLLWVGVGVGLLAVLGIIVFWFLVRKKRRDRKRK